MNARGTVMDCLWNTLSWAECNQIAMMLTVVCYQLTFRKIRRNLENTYDRCDEEETINIR